MEVKDFTNAVEDTADVATGAVISAADTFTNPRRAAKRETDRLERKGAPARRRVHREIGSALEDVQETAGEVAGALLPERIVLRGLSLVRARARRVDLFGELAYRGLDVLHGSVREIARAFTRIERASEPPARPKRPVGRAARTTATQARTGARRTARTARRSARRTTRRTTRRSTAAARRSA